MQMGLFGGTGIQSYSQKDIRDPVSLDEEWIRDALVLRSDLDDLPRLVLYRIDRHQASRLIRVRNQAVGE